MSIRVYLAGPEVFLPNPRQQYERKIALTKAAGLVPVQPGDIDVPRESTLHAHGLAISASDEAMMDSCQAIIANLTPFRGVSADTGTCYELGYMCAQGKLAYAYTNVATPHTQRVIEHYHGEVAEDGHGRLRGPDGLAVEYVDMADNLMMQGGVERRGGRVIVHAAPPDRLYTDTTAFEECLRLLAERVKGAA